MAHLRHRAIALGLRTIGATGLHRLLRPVARGRGIILMLHSVRPDSRSSFAPNRALAVTPEFLARALDLLDGEGFEFVPLDAVPDRLAQDGGRPFAAVTFDDGYRDNRDHALPVLARRGVPWTVFVTTEFADGTGRLWWMELEEALRHLRTVRLPDAGRDLVLRCWNAAEKTRAFAVLHARARRASRPALLAEIDRLMAAAGLDPARLTRALCLDWAELAALAREPGVTIGAHAITHAALATLDPDAARREIADGRRTIQNRLGLPVQHLAYPFGDPGAAGAREFALAREAGFATAVTTRAGHVTGAPPVGGLHALPRVSLNGHFQRASALRILASGVPFLGRWPSLRNTLPGALGWKPSPPNVFPGSS